MPMQTKEPIHYMNATSKERYRYVISEETLEKIERYKEMIAAGTRLPGQKLLKSLRHFLTIGEEYDPALPLNELEKSAIRTMPAADFLQFLMNTRMPTIFAESAGAVAINKGEWNLTEFQILSGVTSVLADLKVFDQGVWYDAGATGEYLEENYTASLIAIPGALLDRRTQRSSIDPDEVQNDRDKLVVNNSETGRPEIDPIAYIEFYKKRLSAGFEQANALASPDKKAFITLPGIGNGAFAGEFARGTIGLLSQAVEALLRENPHWTNIGTVLLDGFGSTHTQDTLIETNDANSKIQFRVENYQGKIGQLAKAEKFARTDDEKAKYQNTTRIKILAWDPFSYEGNDWVAGNRETDEATLAACDGLSVISGSSGVYFKGLGYIAPGKKGTWGHYFQDGNKKQSIADRLYVCKKGKLEQLSSQWFVSSSPQAPQPPRPQEPLTLRRGRRVPMVEIMVPPPSPPQPAPVSREYEVFQANRFVSLIPGMTFRLRHENFIQGNKEHNAAQPFSEILFYFKSKADCDSLVNALKKVAPDLASAQSKHLAAGGYSLLCPIGVLDATTVDGVCESLSPQPMAGNGAESQSLSPQPMVGNDDESKPKSTAGNGAESQPKPEDFVIPPKQLKKIQKLYDDLDLKLADKLHGAEQLLQRSLVRTAHSNFLNARPINKREKLESLKKELEKLGKLVRIDQHRDSFTKKPAAERQKILAVVSVLTLGIGLLVTAIGTALFSSAGFKDTFFKDNPKTDTRKKLDALNEALNQIKPSK